MNLFGTVIWFALAWGLILAVLFKHYYARERHDAKATEEALKRTRRTAGHQYEMDAM